MRDLHPLVRLIANLLFGFLVLGLLLLFSAQMATHHFKAAAERSVRQAFSEDAKTRRGLRYDSVCRSSESRERGLSQCDPLAIKGERSLRSTACSSRSLLRLLGKRWSCVVRFTDGATLGVEVSLGLGHPHLEIVLPLGEPGALESATPSVR